MKGRKVLMRVIEGGQEKIDYKMLFTLILTTPLDLRVGMQMPEVRRNNKILDMIEVSGDSCILTPDDWAYLKKRIEQFPFNRGGKVVQQFADDFDASAEVELEEKAKQ